MYDDRVVTRNRSYPFVVVAVITFLACACSDNKKTEAATPVIERRIATLAPPGSAWMKILETGAASLTKATDGRITTVFYAGGSQGSQRDFIRKIRLGQLDGAVLTSSGLAAIYPGIRVLQLPFLYDSTDEVDYIRDKMWPVSYTHLTLPTIYPV